MAIVVVAVNNTRVEDCDSATGWASIGGGSGASAEPSFPYQGVNLVNRKITSSTGAGFYYDPISDAGTNHDMTTASKRTYMVKFVVTDYGGLQATNGVRVRIGSGTTAYYDFITAGSSSPLTVTDKYPDKGGVVIVPIDPNIAGYRNSTTGSPVLTAVDYFGFVAAFSASSAKSENFGVDAIDLGTGLTLTAGDGVSTEGNFQDYLAFDEGTTNNRYGYVTALNTILNCYGGLTIATATATEFLDLTSKLIFLDGMFNSGWSNITVDLQNASTIVNIGCQIDSLGTDSVVDTRTDFIVTGTSGTLDLSATISNFRNITLTSACEVLDANIECALLTQASADISNSVIKTRSATSIACLQDPTFGTTTDLHDVEFLQTGAGHAIEISTAGTYTFTNLEFTGYGANTTDDAAIDVTASSGTVTINITGGGTPTYKTAGATVVIVNAVLVKITVLDAADSSVVVGARVLLEAAAGGDLTAGDDIIVGITNASGIIENTGFAFTNNQPVTGKVRKGTTTPLYKQSPISGTISSSGFATTIFLVSDE